MQYEGENGVGCRDSFLAKHSVTDGASSLHIVVGRAIPRRDGRLAAENGTGVPWFTAGTLRTPDVCTAIAVKIPGAVAPLVPEVSG